MLLASSHLSLSLSRKKMKNETRDNSRDFDTCHQPSLSFYFLSAGKMLTRTEIRENSSLWKKREKKIPKSEWDGKKKKRVSGCRREDLKSRHGEHVISKIYRQLRRLKKKKRKKGETLARK